MECGQRELSFGCPRYRHLQGETVHTIRKTWMLAIAALLLAPGCAKKKDAADTGDKAETATAGAETPAADDSNAIKAGKGVDVEGKKLVMGGLNAETGPAAAIGKPYAVGKRILAKQVNAGGSGLLPEGWTIELVEKDHQYNPTQAVQHYNAMKDDVLVVGTSFGTPNTLPLREMLERDGLIAFPASLSSEMAAHEHTPPLGPSYNVEAERAMDWAVENAGGADKVKAAIVYQKDDYGADGLAGWKAAAARHGVEIVSEQSVSPGQKDVTAVVAALKKAGANYVLLTVLASATGPIVGTAAQLQYAPTWIGNTPAWIDRFFSPEVIPSAVFGKFHWVSGLTYWGEDVPGMKEFIEAYDKYGKDESPPDFYIMASYVQGLAALEIFRRALENGDVTRAGYLAALHSLDGWNGGGMFQPVSLKAVPYVTSTKTRILKPDFENKSWTEVAPYADPQAAK